MPPKAFILDARRQSIVASIECQEIYLTRINCVLSSKNPGLGQPRSGI